MSNESSRFTRNFRGDAVTASYADVVLDVLEREYAGKPHAAKLLARAAKSSYRSAENWLAKLNAPSGEALINLMVECEALADEVQELVAQRRAAKQDN